MAVAPEFAPLLNRMADVLLLNGNFVGHWGLLHGKTGIAVFLNHYARYSGREVYAEYAGELMEEILTQIDQGSAVHYADGLSGFGVGVEYLVREGFVEADTDEVLESIDATVCHHTRHHTPESLWTDYGVTGLGRYFVARLNNPFNAKDSESSNLLRQELALVIDAMDKPYATYPVLLGVIDVLSAACLLQVNKEKARDYLCYAVDRLEVMVREDEHFGCYPGTFHPLRAALILLRAAEQTGIPELSGRAQWLLQRYEPGFEACLSVPGQGIQSGPLSAALWYHCLSEKGHIPLYAQKSRLWLGKALAENPEALAGLPVGCTKGIPSMGLTQGYAGAGMALLTLSGCCSSHWTELLSYE